MESQTGVPFLGQTETSRGIFCRPEPNIYTQFTYLSVRLVGFHMSHSLTVLDKHTLRVTQPGKVEFITSN